LSSTDPAYKDLAERARGEDQRLGLASLRQISRAASDISDVSTRGGLIAEFEAALKTLSLAVAAEASERDKSANAIFQSVWNAAEPLFAEGTTALDTCPVCATPMEDTTAGGVEGLVSSGRRNGLVEGSCDGRSTAFGSGSSG
jgi:hypothetical protein